MNGSDIRLVPLRREQAWALGPEVEAAWDAAPSDPISVIQCMLPMPDAFGNTRRAWAAEIVEKLGMPVEAKP